MEEHQEVSRHKPPRHDCIEAGFDYPHEGKGLSILAGEWHCPACESRALKKLELQLEIDKLEGQLRNNELKEEELYQRENAGWVEAPLPRPPQRQYHFPPQQTQQAGKGGVRID
jgi:hypothetical protein